MIICQTLRDAQNINKASRIEIMSNGAFHVYLLSEVAPDSTAGTMVNLAPAFCFDQSDSYYGPKSIGGEKSGRIVLKADRTGERNATDAVAAFFEACIAEGCDGYINPGNYKISPGELVFSCATSTNFPTIATDGAYKTSFVFDQSSIIDAPAITVKSLAPYEFWRGGGFGGLAFKDSKSATYQSRHGLFVSGWWAPEMKHIYGVNLNGAALAIDRSIDTNPDPYSVAILRCGIVETNGCRLALDNRAGVGFTNYEIGLIRAVSNRDGVMSGLGTAGLIKSISAANCFGWVLADAGGNLGSLSKFSVLNAEVDNCEYGIKIGNCVNLNIDAFRFVHRRKSFPNPANTYWPRTALSLAETINGNLPAVRDATIGISHRIESGGIKSELGQLATGNNNGNISNVKMTTRIIDNAALGISGADVYKNFQPICIATYGSLNGSAVLAM